MNSTLIGMMNGNDGMTEIQKRLFALQDEPYREFQCKLMPTVDRETVIGVRTPALRKLSRELAKTQDVEAFFQELPHKYFEENNLHGFFIEQNRDFDHVIELLDHFLPYIDNWATCDSIHPKIFAKHLPELLPKIRRWMDSGETYTIRFGMGMLMRYYLDDEFLPEYLELAVKVHSGEYYVNMMTAWFFATALAKQYQETLPYLENHRLEKWVHNKAIQKAVESYRITAEQKTYLKSLKIKCKSLK